MILHRTGLIELDYNEKEDILCVKWPDLSGFDPVEVEHSLHLLLDSIKHYDIKKLLIDSRGTVAEIDQATYRNLIMKLGRGLEETRLKKIARVASADFQRENKVSQITQEISKVVDLNLEFGNFGDMQDARNWLRE